MENIFAYIISGILGFVIGYLFEENIFSDITTFLKFIMTIIWINIIIIPIILVLPWNSW